MKTAYLHMTSAVVGTHDIRQGVHMMSTVPKHLTFVEAHNSTVGGTHSVCSTLYLHIVIFV